MIITGMGRSGSLWLARTLAEVTNLVVRHESIRDINEHELGTIEVNSYLRNQCEDFRMDTHLIHLVRDGRDVVRSCMSRNRGKPVKSDQGLTLEGDTWTFEYACRLWDSAVWSVEPFAHLTLRLEDLIDPENHDAREELCSIIEHPYDPEDWVDYLDAPQNSTEKHSWPHYTQWGPNATRVFVEHCEESMRTVGYDL